MAERNVAALAILDDFSRQPGVSASVMANLRSILDQSPLLNRQFNQAARLGHLRGFAVLADPNAGGTFHPADKRIHLSVISLTTPGTDEFESGEPTFVLGHELQHAFNADAQARSSREFDRAIQGIAESPAPIHDYTGVLEMRLGDNRQDEAAAEIAGWNALVSAVKTRLPEATLEDVIEAARYRAEDFLDAAESARDADKTLAANLHLNADLTLTPTPQNLEAMGQNYFDKDPDDTNLGFRGNSDYANYYAAYAVGRIVALETHYSRHLGERASRIAIDMERLGLSERLLEENGLHLGSAIRRMPYLDLSHASTARRHFDHTYESHEYRPLAPHSDEALQHERETLHPMSPAEGAVVRDIAAYVDRMLQADATGDDATFREMTRALADLPAGRASTARAKADVDAQELLTVQRLREERRAQQTEDLAPPVAAKFLR